LLIKPALAQKERAFTSPHFLADGRSVLFTILSEDPKGEPLIALLDIATRERKVVVRGGTAPQYASTGHLLYASGSALKAVRFNLESKETLGDPIVVRDVAVASTADNGAAEFAVSGTGGTLLHIVPDAPELPLRSLSWVDRQGKEEPLGLEPGRYFLPRVSPDGTRIALDIIGVNRDIWIWNIERQNLVQLTSGRTEDAMANWGRDGKRVFFSSDREGTFDVYSQAADGATGDRLEFRAPGNQWAVSVAPDGARLLVIENYQNLGVLTLTSPARLEPLLHSSSARELLGDVSPDGQWLAYESDESSERIEILLRPFPNVAGGREAISLAGGRYPMWARDGSGELYYVDPEGAMTAVRVTFSPALRIGPPRKLFNVDEPQPGVSGRPYDISPRDGRFLVTRSAGRTAAPPPSISVILNWVEALRSGPP
jgi:hypothetical protein